MVGADKRRLRPVFVVTGPSGRRQGNPDRARAAALSGARPGRFGDHAATAAWGDGRCFTTHFLTREEFDRQGRGREEFLGVGRLRRQPLRDTPFGDRPTCVKAGKAPLLELETEGALRVKRKIDGAVTDLRHGAGLPSSSAACASERPRAPARSAAGSRQLRRQLEQQGKFDHVARKRRSRTRRPHELAAIIERELAAATTGRRLSAPF